MHYLYTNMLLSNIFLILMQNQATCWMLLIHLQKMKSVLSINWGMRNFYTL